MGFLSLLSDPRYRPNCVCPSVQTTENTSLSYNELWKSRRLSEISRCLRRHSNPMPHNYKPDNYHCGILLDSAFSWWRVTFTIHRTLAHVTRTWRTVVLTTTRNAVLLYIHPPKRRLQPLSGGDVLAAVDIILTTANCSSPAILPSWQFHAEWYLLWCVGASDIWLNRSSISNKHVWWQTALYQQPRGLVVPPFYGTVRCGFASSSRQMNCRVLKDYTL